MTRRESLFVWAGVLVAALVLIFSVRVILLPFVVGLVVAYLLDPAADKLEGIGFSRTLATTAITVVFFLGVVGLALVLYPLLEAQVVGFLDRVPAYVDRVRETAIPFLEGRLAAIQPDQAEQMRGLASSVARDAVGWLVESVRGVWQGGVAVFNFLSLFLVTPVVTFYLLRDWDRMVAWIDGLLPRRHAAAIGEQLRLIDEALAGFVRGQGIVALVLGVIFATGWSLAGLEFGLLIGVFAGLLAFIPYAGAVIGFAAAFAVALVQFGFDPFRLGIVTAVFIAAQALDGVFLTPHLVGGRIGLHPIWVMFALMAGGALFGFVGILVAVPVAAVVAVVVRYGIGRYRTSAAYSGAKNVMDDPA
jgi:predicted PurR-regulated permease PerM